MHNTPLADSVAEPDRTRRPSLVELLKIRLIGFLGHWSIRILCATLRWKVEGLENYHALQSANQRIIYTFWHGRILIGTYFFRNRGIVVMTSQNRDGSYIAQVIRKFGYGTARGSSSRGSRRALVTMIRELESKKDVAFAIDGPRGPRYVAKSGAVWLASKTGSAVFPFHFSPDKKWVMKSWDQFQIPKPFTRVLVLMAPGIHITRNAAEKEIQAAQQQLQQVLNELRERGDSYWKTREPA